jgi:hypothetical protein
MLKRGIVFSAPFLYSQIHASLKFMGLAMLAAKVKKDVIDGASFLVPSTFVGGSDGLSAELAFSALMDPCLPTWDTVPRDPKAPVLPGRGPPPGPPRVKCVLDNIDGEFYHLTHSLYYESRVDTGHLDAKVPAPRSRPASVAQLLPRKEHQEMLKCGMIVQLQSILGPACVGWQNVTGRRPFPAYSHILKAAMDRQSVPCGSQIICEQENKTSGIHKISEIVNKLAPGITIQTSAEAVAAARCAAAEGAASHPSALGQDFEQVVAEERASALFVPEESPAEPA